MEQLTLYVLPAHFPWLVLTALDVMHETDLDFDVPALSTLVPASGSLDLGGPQRSHAQTEIRSRLEAIGVRLSEVSLAWN